MIEGIEVKLGEQTFVAAPLNFKALKKFGPLIDEYGAGRKTKMSDLPLLQEVVAASLRRNHPDLSDDYLSEWLDTKNVGEVLMLVMRASGVGALPAGERKPIDEAGQTTIGTT